MAAQSVITSNPNSSCHFGRKIYLNRYTSEYNSSESSDSCGNLENIPLQMQNISSTSYTSILNEPFGTIDPLQRKQLQFQDSGEPYLTILEQPKSQLRFRYKSEKGKHGGLKPVVQLNNYHKTGDIFIKVSLYTIEDSPTEHVFELEAKSSENGNIQQKLSKDNIAKFPSLSVYTKKKDEILSLLEKRIKFKYKEQKKKVNEHAIKREAQEEMKKLSLNAGRLCFEALQENEPICEKIFSEPFYDQKCTSAGDLKIIRLSSYSGKASGGDDAILLCDKIRKDDIEIRFFEEDDDRNLLWEGKGEFNPADVHHQVAIPFKIPQFRENIEKKVYINLYRKSDQKNGETIDFLYIKDEQYNFDFSMRSSKRKKPNSTENTENISTTENPSPFLDIPSELLGDSFLNKDFCSADFDWNNMFEQLGDPSQDVNMEAVVGCVSLTLSKTKIQNSTIENRKSSISPSERIKGLKNWISDILKTTDVNTFLKCLPVLMKMEDENNNTLLHLVILDKSENLLLLLRLLEVAPKNLVNQPNKLHLTPLHLAVSKGLWKHVRLLLRFEANPNLKNQEGNNCVHLATKYIFPQCLCEILAPILCDKVKTIIPDVNALNYEGFAPLHLAVMRESEKCTELLVRSKANINITDGKCGKTPLHMAYECQNPKISEYLISQPHINRRAMDFRGYAPCSVITYVKSESANTKPTECCIEISSESNHSEEENKDDKEKSVIVEELSPIENLEDKLLDILSSNELWKKLGIYLMEEKELEIIEDLEPKPAKTILKTFKKKHKENYLRELKKTFSNDAALKNVYKQLQMHQL